VGNNNKEHLTDGTTRQNEKAGRAQTGVGDLHSGKEAPVMGVERRRVGSANADEAERERSNGPKGLEMPKVPETETRVRKLQKTLYRCAKKNTKWKHGACRESSATGKSWKKHSGR
jgi:hypothetical protein